MRTAPFAASLILLLTPLSAASARADVTHVVQRGHTLEAIAHRYHVTVEAIVEANHLKDGQHIKPGQELVIPGVEGTGKKTDHEGEKTGHSGARGTAVHGTTAAIDQPEPRGHHPNGVIHAIRMGEEFHIRVMDSRGHVSETALHEFARLARQGEVTHPPDPRLVALIGIVSDHFAGKTLEVVSGYRAYTPTQYTPHSNHNYGKALDFRIQGVTNESLRDFCRTLRNTGCGYYPNSTFVHLDARDAKAYWVDLSHPGEAPRYEKPGTLADEGASDVPDERAVQPSTESPTHGAPAHDATSPSGSPEPSPPQTPDDTVKSL